MSSSGPRLGLTLFSFTREYYLCQWTLEDCLARAGALGDGQEVEIIGAQSLRGYPRLTPEVERDVRSAIERHGLVPSCYGTYVERGRSPRRTASTEEAVGLLEAELDIARRLGFPMLRLQTATPDVLSRLLPAAERAGIRIVVELHQLTVETPPMQAVLAMLDQVQSPHLGLLQDLGSMVVRVPASFLELGRRSGVGEAVVKAVADAWNEGTTAEAARRRVVQLGGDERAVEWTAACYALFVRSAPSTLEQVLPHLAHVHAKFFGIDAGGEEPCIPYREILGRLRAGGYDGPIVSEYLSWQPADRTDSFEQVRAHQAMLARIWDEVGAGAPAAAVGR